MSRQMPVNVYDKVKLGAVVYEVVGLESDPTSTDMVVCLRVDEGDAFIPDEDEALDYYRVPLSILVAAKPLVGVYQPPTFVPMKEASR